MSIMLTRDGGDGEHQGLEGAARGERRPLIVKELGGASVGSVEQLHRTARLVLESQREGNDVVVVLNAMRGAPDRLLALARQILPLRDARRLDVLVTTDEQVLVALLAMAIQSQGGQACSILRYQLPLLTDGAFTKAGIHAMERGPIREALAREQIAVVAGFQGVDTSRDIAARGRGGSYTTAVALAAALGADVCEAHTDQARSRPLDCSCPLDGCRRVGQSAARIFRAPLMGTSARSVYWRELMANDEKNGEKKDEENKDDVHGQIEGILSELQTLRDEIRLKIHLAGMELKDTWKDIETRVEDLENKKPEATQMVRDAATELRDAFRALRAKLP